MMRSMVTQDAETFVALGRAVSLAAAEGALDREEAAGLSAALVAGILTGCMELDTYAQVHEALARLLEDAFHGAPVEPLTAVGDAPEPLDVYLEVVGEAWGKVTWDEDACRRAKAFAGHCFELGRAEFGQGEWFRAPLRGSLEALLAAARSAGLLVLSCRGDGPGDGAWRTLRDPTSPDQPGRVLLGWGDRRVALDPCPPPA